MRPEENPGFDSQDGLRQDFSEDADEELFVEVEVDAAAAVTVTAGAALILIPLPEPVCPLPEPVHPLPEPVNVLAWASITVVLGLRAWASF